MTEKNKDRLVYSVTIPLLICLIPIFVAWKSTRSEEIQKLKEQKADKIEVKEQIQDVNNKIDSKLDQEVFQTYIKNNDQLLLQMSQQIQFLYEAEINKKK